MALAVSPLAIGVATFFVVALLTTLLLRQRSPRFVDAFIVAIAVLALVVQLSVGATRTARPAPAAAAATTEAFTTTAPGPTTTPPASDPDYTLTYTDANWDEDIGHLGGGLKLYCSSLKLASYKGDKMWRNVAKVAPQSTCAGGGAATRDLMFSATPSITRREGAQLGANKITGPYSHMLGINADQSMSALVYAQFLGADKQDPISVFQLFANTVGNNGVSLTLDKCTMGINGLISGDAIVQVGDMPSIKTATAVTLDPTHRYLWLLVKKYNRVGLHLIDVSASAFAKTTLIDTTLPTHSSIVFSNVDMTVNGTANWNANLVAFGLYDRPLDDTDFNRIYTHYQDADRAFDGEYQKLQSQLDYANTLKSCPYDAGTCNACGGITDWTVPTNITGASEVCRKQIDTYCTAYPTANRCECWNSTLASYNTTCKTYRSMFSGANLCPPVVVPPPVVQVAAPSSGECTVLSPKNLEAVSKLIDVVQAKRLQPVYADHQVNNNMNPRRPQHGRHKKRARPPMYDDKKKEKKGFWARLFGGGDDDEED